MLIIILILKPKKPSSLYRFVVFCKHKRRKLTKRAFYFHCKVLKIIDFSAMFKKTTRIRELLTT